MSLSICSFVRLVYSGIVGCCCTDDDDDVSKDVYVLVCLEALCRHFVRVMLPSIGIDTDPVGGLNKEM